MQDLRLAALWQRYVVIYLVYFGLGILDLSGRMDGKLILGKGDRRSSAS